jgi:adenine-specific DNA-methyltransferase
MPTKKKTTASLPVTTVKHRDKRANIPTEELRDFVADDEKNLKIVLYPRDPSLDPQLVPRFFGARPVRALRAEIDEAA